MGCETLAFQKEYSNIFIKNMFPSLYINKIFVDGSSNKLFTTEMYKSISLCSKLKTDLQFSAIVICHYE